MANKTVATEASVNSYIAAIDDDSRRADCEEIAELMQEMTGETPKMWGPSMVGFGTYHYKYESGREGDFFRTGFSNRKNAITLYVMQGFAAYDDLMAKLGKYKTGRSCLYIKKLDDIDRAVLKQLLKGSLDYMAREYPN